MRQGSERTDVKQAIEVKMMRVQPMYAHRHAVVDADRSISNVASTLFQ